MMIGTSSANPPGAAVTDRTALPVDVQNLITEIVELNNTVAVDPNFGKIKKDEFINNSVRLSRQLIAAFIKFGKERPKAARPAGMVAASSAAPATPPTPDEISLRSCSNHSDTNSSSSVNPFEHEKEMQGLLSKNADLQKELAAKMEPRAT
ncbi:hypothetical protein HDU87_001884 [Geranomyces variabilis]|uniref:Uncharacterized protein n=1 Tax=Geranomyces variabilis TaxID=109894 RepID=A0AAD5TC50_9FUNG|nr:hypothetical protein HDU87_001884 [Geranomyces variabilis]